MTDEEDREFPNWRRPPVDWAEQRAREILEAHAKIEPGGHDEEEEEEALVQLFAEALREAAGRGRE